MKIDGCPADYWTKIVADLYLYKINLACQRLWVIFDAASLGPIARGEGLVQSISSILTTWAT